MSKLTPIYRIVRLAYIRGMRTVGEGFNIEYGEEFDRWIAVHDAEVAANALERATEDFGPENFYRYSDGSLGHYLQRHNALAIQKRLQVRAVAERTIGE
jgi:hypothetical protein